MTHWRYYSDSFAWNTTRLYVLWLLLSIITRTYMCDPLIMHRNCIIAIFHFEFRCWNIIQLWRKPGCHLPLNWWNVLYQSKDGNGNGINKMFWLWHTFHVGSLFTSLVHTISHTCHHIWINIECKEGTTTKKSTRDIKMKWLLEVAVFLLKFSCRCCESKVKPFDFAFFVKKFKWQFRQASAENSQL